MYVKQLAQNKKVIYNLSLKFYNDQIIDRYNFKIFTFIHYII
jgi:hypothetical protein